jgi:integrase
MYKRWRLKLKQEEDKARIAKGNKPIPGDGKVAINREITLFTGIWNFARENGFTKLSNPAEGVERFTEIGRGGIYTEDEVMDAVYKAGDQALKNALDLAYLTSQRRADVLAMTESMIRPAKYRHEDGSTSEVKTIPIKQEKTGNKIRMIIDGELKALIERIQSEKKAHKVISLALLVTESGERMTMHMLRGRFEKARKLAAEAADESGDNDLAKEIRTFQYRDLRAKAGTDKVDETGSMVAAQKMLGHSAASTTEIYIRQRRGALVKPTR